VCGCIQNACLSFERCFEKNVNFVITRVWMYTKYCLFVLKKQQCMRIFVCFDLSKKTRRSTLSYMVFILFPLKIYPFTGYKSKVRFCTQNSRILTLILKKMRKGLPEEVQV